MVSNAQRTQGGKTAAARLRASRAPETPRRKGAMIGKPKPKATNAMRNQAARKQMTPCEVQTGKTVEQIDAEMAEQRARMLAKYGGTDE